MVVLKQFFLIVVFLFVFSEAWDLSHLGITNYSVHHVSILKNRAYLSIKILDGLKNKVYPTLIDAPWPENDSILFRARALPSKDFHHHRNCKYLQQVISTDVDIRGRLWVLDEGSKDSLCSAKLMVINIYTNLIVQVYHFEDRDLNFSSVLADPTLSQETQRCYIGVSNANVLFVCKLGEEVCNQYIMSEERDDATNSNVGLVSTEQLAISKYDYTLYITSPKCLPLFEISLDLLRSENLENNIIQVEAHYQGDKLGPSKGLLFDSGNGLSYYLPRDFAVVRWDNRKPLGAEGHSVLLQSFEQLPDVTQLFSDQQGNVWALLNKTTTFDNTHFIKNPFKSINFKKHPLPLCLKIFNYDQFY